MAGYAATYDEWLLRDSCSRKEITLCGFARELLSEISADIFGSEAELERQVYALGRLAEQTVQQSLKMSAKLRASTEKATIPLLRSGGRVITPLQPTYSSQSPRPSEHSTVDSFLQKESLMKTKASDSAGTAHTTLDGKKIFKLFLATGQHEDVVLEGF